MSNKLPTVTSPPWNTTTKRIVALITLMVLYLLASSVSSTAWSIIVIAVLLAYLLSPVVKFFERRLQGIDSFEMRRTLAVLLTWLVVLGMLGLGVGLVIPAIITQLRDFAETLPDLMQNTERDLRRVLDREITIGSFEVVPWEEIQSAFSQPSGDSQGGDTTLTDTLQNAVLSLADTGLGLVGGIVAVVLNVFFILVMLFYLMRDGPLFVEFMVNGLPESYQGDARRLLHELGEVWNAYLRGQLLLCFAVGVATYINALILGLPQPLLLGLVAGFLEFIPNIGPALSQVPALLFAFTTSSSTIPGLEAGIVFAGVVSLSYVAIQQLEAIFLVPRILGGSLDLHPFVVLVGVVTGASVGGILGVILAAPAIATMRVFLRYIRGKLLDEDIFVTGGEDGKNQHGMVYYLLHFFFDKRFPVLPQEEPEPSDSQEIPSHETEEPEPERPDVSGWMSG